MRNLKRALSLTLASVMLLGMMVVGSSAAAGYDDVAETDNVEAIEVLQAIEVMVGDERGFGPERPVNRAEMAVVMGKLLNLDYNYYASSCPFNDVYDWARGWVGACYANKIVSGRGEGVYDPGATVTAVEAASMLMRALGYFQYANDVADGFELSTVRQGTKIGIFDNVGSSSTEPMTRNQVAQMVLNALQTGMAEPDGQTINLTTPDGQVYTGKVNYVNVTSSKPFATSIKRTVATSVGSTNDGYIVELGEQLYNGELKLHEYTDDDFMRPSRTWEFKGKEIGTYMKKENIRAEYTAGVSNRTLYDLLGRSSLQEYTVSHYLNGVLYDTNVNTANGILSRTTNNFPQTGRGVLTQVFVDTEAETIDITSINTYLAQATADYSETTESVILKIYCGVTGTNTNNLRTNSANLTVSKADVDNIDTVTKDQFVTVNVSGKINGTIAGLGSLTNYEVITVAEPEIMSDSTLTKFSKRGSDDKTNSNQIENLFSSVVTGGTEYKSSAKAYYSDDVLELYDDQRLSNKTYNVYLDKYGYALGLDLYSGDDNYVFITGFDPSGSNISLGSAKAGAIFPDGTMKTITVNVKDTNKNIDKVDGGYSYFKQWAGETAMAPVPLYTINRWYTYTTDASGDYTLNPATRMFTTEVAKARAAGDTTSEIYPDGLTIKTNSVRIDEDPANVAENDTAKGRGATFAISASETFHPERAYGNDNSIFIVVEAEEVVDESNDYVISDVSGVYTGVQNVEIEVADKATSGTTTTTTYLTGTELYDSIYTLYNKDNYIIASIIVGEAKGSNANYAYILTAATSEEKLEDGTYIWEFDAVVDGKVTTLKTNSKFTKVISDLRPGHIQELRYTGDYVTGVKTPDDPDLYYEKADAFSRRIDEEEIYDVGHNYKVGNSDNHDCVNGAADHQDKLGNTFITDTTHLDKTEATSLTFDGRTMYLNPRGTGADYGLAFVTDAPAVVIHEQDDDWKTIQCSSVTEAISKLGDANKSTTDKKEFEGRIVAVLNSQGVAKWVVFISDTPVYTTPGGTVTGQETELTAKSNVSEVQALLNNRKNVKIPGNWKPEDADFGDSVKLTIPAGTTLTVDGNFEAWDSVDGERVRIDGTGTLKVNGKFVTSSEVSDEITYKVDAKNVELNANDDVTIKADMDVANKMIIDGAASNDVTIASNVTVDIAGNLENKTASRQLIINGTLKTTGSIGSASGQTLTINVLSTYSLHAGVVNADVAVNVGSTGSGAKEGRAVIGNVNGATVNVINTSTTAPTTVTTVTAGTVDVKADAEASVTTVKNGATVTASAAGASLTVATAENGSILKAENATASLTITEKLDTPKITATAGSTVTLAAGTEITANAPTIKDSDGNEMNSVGNGGDVTLNTDSDINNTESSGNISTNEKAPAGTEAENPFTVTAPASGVTCTYTTEVKATSNSDTWAMTNRNSAGTVKVSGKITDLLAGASEEQAVATIKEYTGQVVSTVAAFKEIYELDEAATLSMGFFKVSANNSEMMFVVVDEGNGWRILFRNDMRGDALARPGVPENQVGKFTDSTQKFGEIFYTVDITGLTK